MKTTVRRILSGVLAGICIAVGAMLYLSVGGIVGAILFSVGLLCVISEGNMLFTGQAWKYSGIDIIKVLVPVILGNIAGCCLGAWLCSNSLVLGPVCSESAVTIINSRVASGWFLTGCLAIPCGFLMTCAVRSRDTIIVVLCVMSFILCGFPHCIADVFYYFFYGMITETAWIYLATIIGNYIGCNLYRIAD